MPKRIQLSRAKGWRLPPNTVIVDRRTKWGNEYRVNAGTTAAQCVTAFEIAVKVSPRFRAAVCESLRGKDLACWCKLGEPCHADVLLRIANGVCKMGLKDRAIRTEQCAYSIFAGRVDGCDICDTGDERGR